MPAGVPRSCSISKASRLRISPAIVTVRMAGERIGRVMRRNIPQGPEPHTRADSSIAASNCLKAGISKMVITGTVVRVK